MTTTPTLWGTDVIFQSLDPFAFNPKVAALSDGTFAIAWQDGADTDLFGRHLNELGSFTGGNFLQTLSGNTTKDIHGPQIFEQADGRLVVEYRLQFSSTDTDIHWHSADINNFPPSGNTFPIENSAFDEFMLDATALPTGGSAVAYQYDQGGSHLVIRFVDALGNQASNRIFVEPSATRAELNPALSKLGIGGNVMVAYESFHNTTFDRDIRMHMYKPDGTDLSGEVIVSAPGVNAAFPDVVALEGPGGLRNIICWQQADGIAYRSYFGFIPLDAAPKLIPGTGGTGAILPKITALNDGGFVIAWTFRDGTESDGSTELDIRLQRFDVNGNTVGSQVHIDKPGDQGFFGMSIDTLDDGRVILTFGNETGDATNVNTLNYRIYDPRENLINATSGDDNWVGREDGSTMNGFGGNDKLTGREAQDFLNGGQGNDTLRGFGGNDVLDGGTEVDTMIGGQGNDIYRVDNVNDVVTELAGEGTDSVYTKVSYGLAANTSVEQLRVLGPTTTNAVNLTGNGLNNVLVGNNGANGLNGGAGADIMRGLGGNDIYIVDNAGDQVFEAANQGTDTVRTSVSYTLASGQSIEILRVHNPLSTNAINLTGNQLNNTIIGNNGANVINGGAGNDTLIGSGGNDFFLFNTALNAATNVDTITAYSVAQDTIRLENAVFSTLAVGVLNADAFHIGAAAADAEDRIIYNSATGGLFYDSNGTGAGGTTQFAKVAPGLALTNADFFAV